MRVKEIVAPTPLKLRVAWVDRLWASSGLDTYTRFVLVHSAF
jgi:hypothetical protein